MGRHHGVAAAAACVLAALPLSSLVETQGLLAPLPLTANAPADNPTTPEKVELGRLLFWDPVLSGEKDVACASCHHPRFAYTDARDLPIGARPIARRNTPTIVNSAFNGMGVLGSYDPSSAPMFWDARARSLEAQALEPLKVHEEMRGDAYPEASAVGIVVERIAAIDEYRARFTRAFDGTSPVTPANLGRAIAAFERSLLSIGSPFDRYMRGDASAMSAAAVRGMQRFERFGCSNCHKGPMFSDYDFHVLGIPDHPTLEESDSGFGRMYAFRTPSLRNVALTSPYMHNGVFRSLEDVVDFYDSLRRGGGLQSGNPHVKDGDLDQLLTRMVGGGGPDLIAFLEALTDESFDRNVPQRVPSGLIPGGRVQ